MVPELRDSYQRFERTDEASAAITVEFEDGSIKKKDHYFGYRSAPKILTWLEDKIDEIVGTKPYVKFR